MFLCQTRNFHKYRKFLLLKVLFLFFSVPLRKVRIVLEDPRSSFTAEMSFRVANDKVFGLSQRRQREDVGAGVAKGPPGILD